MASTRFDEFCVSIAALVGMDAPRLEADERGITAFTLTCRDAPIAFVERDEGVLMLLEFGQPEEASQPAIWRGLLETNFLMSHVRSPMFVCNPETGVVALHQSWPASAVDAREILACAERAAGARERWLAGEFTAALQDVVAGQPADAAAFASLA